MENIDNIALAENNEKYFIEKYESVESSLALSNSEFLKNSYSFMKVRELKKDVNFNFLVAGWATRTALLMGIKEPIPQFTKADIMTMITSYWNMLSIEDMVKAFEMERFNQFKEQTEHFQLFDANYISKIFKKYAEWKSKTKIEMNISNESEEMELSQEAKDNLVREQINNSYIAYMDDFTIPLVPNIKFDFLVECGIISVANEMAGYYAKKRNQAVEQIKEKYNHENAKTELERKTLIRDAMLILNSEKNLDFKVKEIVLLEYYDKQIKSGKQKIFNL
jgi:hypothetical protein